MKTNINLNLYTCGHNVHISHSSHRHTRTSTVIIIWAESITLLATEQLHQHTIQVFAMSERSCSPRGTRQIQTVAHSTHIVQNSNTIKDILKLKINKKYIRKKKNTIQDKNTPKDKQLGI